MVFAKESDVERVDKGILRVVGLFFIGLVVLTLIVLVSIFFMIRVSDDAGEVSVLTCGDGTPYGSCSDQKPFFCEEHVLVEKASLCGCPEGMEKSESSCSSKYKQTSKEINLKYILRGEEKYLQFTVYEELDAYLMDLSRFISYGSEFNRPTRRDFKLKNIDEVEQKKLLYPLVIEIQNLAPEDNVEQARIAISLVQNIDFGDSGRPFVRQGDLSINYSRYPYEVLYDMKGVCGEKSELLAFLLRELGYGVAFFYYGPENHEALGIKCPLNQGISNTGYCFVETTGPAIITDNQISYVGGLKLTSNPEIVVVSEGEGLPDELYEYEDALSWMNIRYSIKKNGRIPTLEYSKWKNLREKYGIGGEYNA